MLMQSFIRYEMFWYDVILLILFYVGIGRKAEAGKTYPQGKKKNFWKRFWDLNINTEMCKFGFPLSYIQSYRCSVFQGTFLHV